MISQQSVLVLTMRADFKGPTRSVVHIQIYLCWKIFVDLENVINCCIRIKKNPVSSAFCDILHADILCMKNVL